MREARGWLYESEVEELVYQRFLLATQLTATSFVELGAGHGFQAVRFQRTLASTEQACTKVQRVSYVLVEPYPPHLPHLARNLAGFDYRIIAAAVAERSGAGHFLDGWEGKGGVDFWGGHLTPAGDIEVRTCTLAEILHEAALERISFLHMDIQGAEVLVAPQCCELVDDGRLDNLYVGTHDRWGHDFVKRLLSRHIELRIDAPPHSRSRTAVGEVEAVDGILFFSRTLDPKSRPST